MLDKEMLSSLFSGVDSMVLEVMQVMDLLDDPNEGLLINERIKLGMNFVKLRLKTLIS